MNIKIVKDGNNMMNTNSYLVYDKESKDSYIIDAPTKTQKFIDIIEEEELNLKYVLLTHAHFDHTEEIDFWREKYDVKIVAHELSKTYLENPEYNLSTLSNNIISNYADIYLSGDTGQFEIFKYIRTPGHSFDGITYILGNLLFVGDLIFKESIGRNDFIGSNYEDQVHSIKEIIYKFNDDCIILPGHGANTTVEHEKKYNPFIPY